MTLLLDAGAFIAAERGDSQVEALIRQSHRKGTMVRTHGGIVGQVWRGPRQVTIARLLQSVETRPLDAALGRDAGRILSRSGSSDVLDAALIAIAGDGDEIVTSDPSDMALLAHSAGVTVRLLVV